ncbi:MAG: transporter substrate-binding domain-containing protein [Gammaproteobacteria bacterium]|nr:transporter substrate-binding domain-containing protein [Gammaproteobacteria bacterium]
MEIINKLFFFFLISTIIFSEHLLANNINLTAAEKSFLKQNPVIRVANEMDWPPFDYVKDKKTVGYSIDHINLLAKKIGVKIQFINGYKWAQLVDMFKNKQIDIMPVFYKNKERENFTLFTTPYTQSILSLYSTEGNKKLLSINDLNKNLKIGMQSGEGSIPYIRQKFPNIDIVEINGTKETLKALASNQVDGIIENPFIFHYFVKRYQLFNLQLVDFIEPFNRDLIPSMHIGVRRDMPLLHQILQKAMNSLTPQEKTELEKNWLTPLSIIKKKSQRIAFNSQEQIYLSNKKKITTCVQSDLMPFEKIKDSQYIGMTADYLKVIEEKIAKKMDLVITKNWTESLTAAKARKCDIFSSSIGTKESKTFMKFTQPYLSIPVVIATTSDKLFVTDLDEIKLEKIGIVKGAAYAESIKKQHPTINIIEVDSLSQGLKLVVQGKLFGLIGDLSTLSYQIQKKYFGSLKITGRIGENWALRIGVRNDDYLLLTIINKAVASIDEKTKQSIFNQWMSIRYEQGFNYTLLWKILAIIILIVIVIIYRYKVIHSHNKQLQVLNHELELLATTDPLTKLFNRRYLDSKIHEGLNLAKRYKTPFSIIIIDIDDFKAVNDTHGHDVGDLVLEKFSNILSSNSRVNDIVGRWGGEEFLIILPQVNLEEAKYISQKICSIINDTHFEIVSSMTASMGLTIYKKGDSFNNIIKRADQALYKAKQDGKNRVVSL